MDALSASLWRLERDDAAQCWRAVEDDSTIFRYGFTRADFPAAQPPELPEYIAPETVIPQAVSMRKARLALLGAGKLAAVNAAIAAMPGVTGEAARIEWEYAQEVRRDSPLVAGLSASLGFDSAAMDALFTAASAL
jgi:hypothetical protein